MAADANALGMESAGAAGAGRRLRRALSGAGGRVLGFLSLVGLGWVAPMVRLVAGEDPRAQLAELWRGLGVPVLAIGAFLVAWGQLASRIDTSLGAIPGPRVVWEEALVLVEDHNEQRERRAVFFERQRERNAALLAENPDADVRLRDYTGAPTYFDQIVTSLETVFAGFLLATVVAIPLGVMAGLSQMFNAAINPLIQIFKPVSPLAWLPIVTMVVSAVYVTDDPMFEKSFLNSAITVTLCSLWPALVNTSVGVASIDRDLMNVGRVLRLGWTTKVFKIVLPSALPLIFTGLRLSLGVGWMVLIAAEMLAQNPGLGKFVWDEFQNGSSSSLAKIMVAVLTIGIIGFLLDRVMFALQSLFTFSNNR